MSGAALPAAPASQSAPPELWNPFCFVIACWRHRSLARRLARRRVEAQYRGSMLGLAWAVLQPLLLLSIYTFVFSSILDARWPQGGAGSAGFALNAFAGMVLFGLFSRAANDGANLLLNHATLLKQVVFPSEVLSMASVAAALFDLTIGLALWTLFHLFGQGLPPATILALPVVLLPLLLFSLGASWLLASLGVFLRDLAQVTSLTTTALYFLSPIFYPASRVPPDFAAVYAWNPFVGLITSARELMLHGAWPAWSELAVLTLVGWLFAWSSYAWFMRTRHSFADVL
jgi:lipopolysaccharide transport system permease protein